jgi:hypothetical protein
MPRLAALAIGATAAAAFAGCGALIGLDSIDHVACVGPDCGAGSGGPSESGADGFAEGATGIGIDDASTDLGPIPEKEASTLSDGATCTPFKCPNGSDLCDWFDGTRFGSWNSTPGSAITDTAAYPLMPCGAPSSVRLDVGAGSSATFRKSLSSPKISLDADVLPRFTAWDKVGRVVLFSVTFLESCGDPNAELTLEGRADGIYLQACPGDGCTACNSKKLGALPATDGWQHITITGDFTNGQMNVLATFGGAANSNSVMIGNLGGPLQLSMQLGAQAREGSGAFSINYDDVALDLK